MTDAALHRLGGRGPDVLLINGFGGDRLSWLAVAPQLFERASVWAVEFGGHGAAGNDVADGSAPALCAAIEAEAEGRLTRPLVVGHSLGGTLALHLAARGTLDPAGLVLLAPAGVGKGPDLAFIEALPELDDGAAALELLQRLVVRKVLITRRMADAFVASLAGEGRREALRTIASAARTASPAPFPPEIPFTILWGASDGIVPPPDVPTPGLRMLPDTGHMPQVEAAAEVVEAISQQLDGMAP